MVCGSSEAFDLGISSSPNLARLVFFGTDFSVKFTIYIPRLAIAAFAAACVVAATAGSIILGWTVVRFIKTDPSAHSSKGRTRIEPLP